YHGAPQWDGARHIGRACGVRRGGRDAARMRRAPRAAARGGLDSGGQRPGERELLNDCQSQQRGSARIRADDATGSDPAAPLA
ncbi:MAG: hypothetical protein KJ018_20705, partial [Burkholderiales bacterium]|nr:hypothetical protein [Burkholderiales bacterium]